MEWPGDMMPEDNYMFSYIPEKTLDRCDFKDPVDWTPLSHGSESIMNLMRWLHIYHVLGNGDRSVICWEEAVYFVSGFKFDTSPWCAIIQVFDVRLQCEAVCYFRLRDGK